MNEVAPQTIALVVCGAHLSGMPLNHQLTERGATLKSVTLTAPCYNLYAISGNPPRPGLVRVQNGGAAIHVEVWNLPAAGLASFLKGIPAPLGLGKVLLADRSEETGFICEPIGVVGARDISSFGGWRSYIAHLLGKETASPDSARSVSPPDATEDVVEIAALPGNTSLSLAHTALLIIDMQRDFIEPGGFGASLGNDITSLRSVIEPCRKLLDAARQAGLLIIHTREGHSPSLDNLHPEKRNRGIPGKRIGDMGPMGRILISGEPGHDFIERLRPVPGELVVDKPGKGAFYATELDSLLQGHGVNSVIVCGVTTEVCVHTTVREANDRGYRVIVPEDCCGSYFAEFHRIGLQMIHAQGGIFGYVCHSRSLLEAFSTRRVSKAL